MQDDKNNWSLRVPLTPEQLAWWQERMRRTIHHVRLSFPRARIVYRKMHRTDDVLPGTQYITNCELRSPWREQRADDLFDSVRHISSISVLV